jgi:hypothetical protein
MNDEQGRTWKEAVMTSLEIMDTGYCGLSGVLRKITAG